jgi:hypothetical protein
MARVNIMITDRSIVKFRDRSKSRTLFTAVFRIRIKAHASPMFSIGLE